MYLSFKNKEKRLFLTLVMYTSIRSIWFPAVLVNNCITSLTRYSAEQVMYIIDG